jgi:hypothetical protein
MNGNIISASQIELAIAKYFNPRQNLIVPNVWWGLGFNYELDLVVLTKCGYAYEVEIKVSRQDIKADLKKLHQHSSKRISRLYFAVPDKLSDDENIPQDAGILSVTFNNGKYVVRKIRESKRRDAKMFTDKEKLKLAELGAMRIWKLKSIIETRAQ